MTDRTMHRSPRLLLATAAAAALAFGAGSAAADDYSVDTVAEGLDRPWGMAFLPDGETMLVTLRGGTLVLLERDGGETEEIADVPEVVDAGQGGLLDVALHPEFEDEPWVYLTWSGENDEGLSSTYVGRGQLDRDAMELAEFETLYVVEPHVDSGGHFGSRLAFDDEGYLFVSVGDRQSKDFGPEHYSQQTDNAIGTTLRLNADGSVPEDNPFVDDVAVLEEIYSYGHRNVQAMAFHPETGALWQAEHGEFNGDEINIVEAGGNYGWPIATFGVDYQTQERFAPTPPEVPETIDPVYHWTDDDPEGFPPSGFVFYDGDAFPDWQGDAFIGNLAHEYLGRFAVDGSTIEPAGRLLEGEGWRIRDVAVGPDTGYLYVLTDGEDARLVRLVPAEAS